MKENNSHANAAESLRSNLCLVPEGFLQNIIILQDKILQLLEGQKSANLNGFITEKQAIEILNKKGTWFWQMRRDGKLSFKRIGKTIYYSSESINALLQNS